MFTCRVYACTVVRGRWLLVDQFVADKPLRGVSYSCWWKCEPIDCTTTRCNGQTDNAMGQQLAMHLVNFTNDFTNGFTC